MNSYEPQTRAGDQTEKAGRLREPLGAVGTLGAAGAGERRCLSPSIVMG